MKPISVTSQPNSTRVAIGIATAGRAQQVLLTLREIAKLQPSPIGVWIAPASEDDIDWKQAVATLAPIAVHLVRPRRKGLTIQRNAILDALDPIDVDVVTFFDDDFYPASDYLQKVTRVMAENRSVIGLTGCPVMDGATGPGIPHEIALQSLQSIPVNSNDIDIHETYGTYGCNMSYRLEKLRKHHLRFDEELPLYAWLEDIDFSRQAASYGSIVASDALHGVHLGTKAGRVSGRRFGYSQIVNPVYCAKKGTIAWSYASRHIVKNILANMFKSIKPEPWVDRRGRLYGNLMGLWSIAAGRVKPSLAVNI